MSSAARYRGGKPARSSQSPSPSPPPSSPTKEIADAVREEGREQRSRGLSILDILRVLSGILVLSAGTSYLSTSGESMTWGYNPWWTRAREWKTLLQNRPLQLTPEQLSLYNGTDPSLPIYLALNGSIYDVSINPSTYGPGGSYHHFSGRDCARAFLTGCFAEDCTPDLRGVSQMFMPVDPWEREIPGDVSAVEKLKMERERAIARQKAKGMSKGDMKIRRERERRVAREKVKEGLEHWHVLFRGDKGKRYRKVGDVVREEGWLAKLPKRGLCEQAEKSRPLRKYV